MIIIDYKDTRPIYEQIAEKFETLIRKGVLKPDSKMPSVRSLAIELSINPNTIQKAFERLERNGYIYPIKGRGNYVAQPDSLILKRKEELRHQLLLIRDEALELGMTNEDLITCLKGGEQYD